MNPFKMRPERTGDLFVDWEKFWVKPYNKNEVNPYTRTRIILMNGTEFENVWFSHQFSRSVGDDELRRKLAYIRKSEQQQQKILTHLKPADESALEHTIGYEQLAVDLTAHLSKRVNDKNIKSALDFALLEDFDHLYRYADYLDFTTGEHAEKLVGGYTEITPGRPTISHHRHPYDSIRYPMTDKCPATMDVLAANVITAAEQQTMNYYMNTAALWPDEMGRRLYQEIGMVEEQHVTQYGSLLKPCMSRLENLLVHQYVECWLYWSCYETETDTRIRGIWQFMFEQELKHLHIALELLRQYEKKDWQEVIPDAEFPAPLVLESNIEYLPDMEDIYFKTNEDKLPEDRKVGYIVITADKGLAGSYNHNILKMAEEHLKNHPNHSLFVLGELGRHYFEQRGIEIEKQFHYTVQNPTLNRARNIAEEILELYLHNELDEVYIIYTSMINAIQEETQMSQLLPLKKADFTVQIPIDIPREELALKPSPEAVMDRIVPNYVVGFVYGALVESFSCEQNARMMAMQSASNSARDMLAELDILYNRARQAAITQEITEVIAGAKSQKKKRK